MNKINRNISYFDILQLFEGNERRYLPLKVLNVFEHFLKCTDKVSRKKNHLWCTKWLSNDYSIRKAATLKRKLLA